MDSTLWFLQIPCQWNLYSRFQFFAGFRIPWAKPRIPKPRIPDYTSKNFPDLGIHTNLLWVTKIRTMRMYFNIIRQFFCSFIQINTVVFIIVMYRMLGTKFIQDKKQIEKVKAGIKASMVILPLLGLTWLFGLLGFSSDTIVFKYMFAILNSLQGLMIFIFHCALNKEVRKVWVLFVSFCKLGRVPLHVN